MINAVGWISVAPVYALVMDVSFVNLPLNLVYDLLQLYGVSPLIVNTMSYSFMALYLPMNFPCVYVIEKWGLRWGIIGGIASTALGLWIRTFLN